MRPLAHLAQIVLVAVAIFGYFYTVRPVYQKERLQEQVASYELDISRQLAEIGQAQQRLQALEGEAASARKNAIDAQQELTDARADLKLVMSQQLQLQAELGATQLEKQRIEQQIEYMQFTYLLADGSPADTPAKVEQAKAERERRRQQQRVESQRANFFTLLDWGASRFTGNRPLLGTNYDIDADIESYPFSPEEVELWEAHNTQYPRFVAESIVEARDASQGLINWAVDVGEVDPENLKAWKQEAYQRIELNYAEWSPPHDPLMLIADYPETVSSINTAMTSELEQVEAEYGNWAKERNAQRRIVLEHNYTVSLGNARRMSKAKLINLEYQFRSNANEVRSSVSEEVSRLLQSPADPVTLLD